jgi:polyisoprenoid-binding protein YceI
VSGTVKLDSANPGASSLEAQIDVHSIDTATRIVMPA